LRRAAWTKAKRLQALPWNRNHLATNASNPIILQQLLYGRQVLRSNKEDGRTFAKSIIDMKEEPGCGYQRLDYRHVLVAKLRNRHERVVRPYCSHNPNSSRPDSHYGAHVTRVPILKRTGSFSHRGRAAVRIGRPAGLLSEGTPAYQVLYGGSRGPSESGECPPSDSVPGLPRPRATSAEANSASAWQDTSFAVSGSPPNFRSTDRAEHFR
jgi:hypothetical protein